MYSNPREVTQAQYRDYSAVMRRRSDRDRKAADKAARREALALREATRIDHLPAEIVALPLPLPLAEAA